MALYGAPVWARSLTAQCRTLLRSPQKTMAARVVRAYKSVSADAVCALAGTPPWDLEAEVLAEVYHNCAAVWEETGRRPLPETIRGWRNRAHQAVLLRWKARLEVPVYGVRTVGALQPVLERWAVRQHGTLTFRTVQVLSGHGCFGEYLHKFPGKEPSPACHHCDCSEDTAQHTLEHCPAWVVQRRDLAAIIGDDLSLPTVVRAMVDSDRKWGAVATFCEDVISQKEAAERVRENDIHADPIRRRRPGRRRRAEARLMPP